MSDETQSAVGAETMTGQRIWFDTEFYENGRPIELISIGMVREDGETFYAETLPAQSLCHGDDWLRKNVLPHLRGTGMLRPAIAEGIKRFAGEKPEFWAYYADYDWVALCQLYGRMIDLPEGWPMFCRDVKQEADRLGVKLPKQTTAEHDALADALWTRDAWQHLQTATPRRDSDEGSAGGDGGLKTAISEIVHRAEKDQAFLRRTLARMREEAAPAPATPPGVPDSVREEMARAIDPGSFAVFENTECGPINSSFFRQRIAAAYRIADTLLAGPLAQRLSAHPAGQSTGLGVGVEPRRMAEGCCSAVSPCSHQLRDPYSLCEVCARANRLSDKVPLPRLEDTPTPDSTRTGVVGTEEALRGIADDYMTSEKHHPGYVLIPAEKFDQLRAASDALAARPAPLSSGQES